LSLAGRNHLPNHFKEKFMATATATKTMVPLTQGLINVLIWHYEQTNFTQESVHSKVYAILTDETLTDSEKFNKFADYYHRVRGYRQGKSIAVVRGITHEALSFNLTEDDLNREW
jgi:hypothetical protein